MFLFKNLELRCAQGKAVKVKSSRILARVVSSGKYKVQSVATYAYLSTNNLVT